MLFDKLHTAGGVHPPKFLPDNTMYFCQMGSVAYGVSTDMSDVDIYGFCKPSADAREAGCPFCDTTGRELVAENSLAVVFRDLHPVTPLYTLVIPRRHAVTFFDLYEPERRATNLLLDQLRANVQAADGSVTGFNIE